MKIKFLFGIVVYFDGVRLKDENILYHFLVNCFGSDAKKIDEYFQTYYWQYLGWILKNYIFLLHHIKSLASTTVELIPQKILRNSVPILNHLNFKNHAISFYDTKYFCLWYHEMKLASTNEMF